MGSHLQLKYSSPYLLTVNMMHYVRMLQIVLDQAAAAVAVPRLGQAVAGFSPQRHRFDPRSVCVRFVVALG